MLAIFLHMGKQGKEISSSCLLTLSKVRVEDLCRKEGVDSEPADEESKPCRLLTELDVGNLKKMECVNHTSG